MKPLTCPGCYGRRTNFTVTAPSKGGADSRPSADRTWSLLT